MVVGLYVVVISVGMGVVDIMIGVTVIVAPVSVMYVGHIVVVWITVSGVAVCSGVVDGSVVIGAAVVVGISVVPIVVGSEATCSGAWLQSVVFWGSDSPPEHLEHGGAGLTAHA